MKKTILILLFLTSGLVGIAQQAYPVKQENKWGLIDQNGNVISPCIWDEIGAFENGRAIFTHNHLSGIVNSSGKILVKADYDIVKESGIRGTYFIGKASQSGRPGDLKWGLYLSNEDRIISPQYDELGKTSDLIIKTYKEGKYGLVHLLSGELLPTEYRALEVQRSDNDFRLLTDEGTGWFTGDSLHLIQPRYQEIERLHKGFKIKENGLWGICDSKGKPVTECSYDSIYSRYNSQIIYLVSNSKTGVATLKKGEIIPCEYNYLESLKHNFFLFKQGHKKGVICPDGRILKLDQYSDYKTIEPENLVVQKDDKWGMLDREGEEVIPVRYKEVRWLSDPEVYAVKTDTSWILYHLKEGPQTNIRLDEIAPFMQQIATATSNKKQGLIDRKGNWVVPPQYKRIDRYEGVARLFRTTSEKEEIDLIFHDDTGKLTDTPKFIVIEENRSDNAFATRTGWWGSNSSGVAVRNIPGRIWLRDGLNFGLYDRNTERWLISPRYYRVSSLPNTWLTQVSLKSDRNKFALVDHKSAKQRSTYIFTEIRATDFFEHDIARVKMVRNKYGIINKRGHLYTREEITYAGAFSEGKMRVCIDGRSSWATENSQLSLDSKVFEQRMIHSGVSKTKKYLHIKNGKWGYMTGNGKWALKPTYEYAGDFVNGHAIVMKNGLWGVIDSTFAEVIPVVYSQLKEVKCGKEIYFAAGSDQVQWGAIDRSGNTVIPAGYRSIYTSTEGVTTVKGNHGWRLLDQNGNQIGDGPFVKAGEFSSGLAAVAYHGKWGFMDQTGTWKIKPKWGRVQSFSEGRTFVREKNHWRLIDENGNYLSKIRFIAPGIFRDSVAVTRSPKYGLLSHNGEWILPPRFNKIEFIGIDLYKAHVKGGYLVYDQKGNKISGNKYYWVGKASEGCIPAGTFNRFGVMDTHGNTLIPFSYQAVGTTKNGLIPVKHKGKWGLFDKSGNQVVPFEYVTIRVAGEEILGYGRLNSTWEIISRTSKRECDNIVKIRDFHNGLAAAQNPEGLWGYLGTSGRWIIPPTYEDVSDHKNGLCAGKVEGKWLLMNSNGGQLTSARFSEIHLENQPLIPVAFDANHQLLDTEGNIVLPGKYEAFSSENALIKVEKNGQIGYLDSNVKWVWEVK